MIVTTMASNNFSVDFFARKEGRICGTLFFYLLKCVFNWIDNVANLDMWLREGIKYLLSSLILLHSLSACILAIWWQYC